MEKVMKVALAGLAGLVAALLISRAIEAQSAPSLGTKQYYSLHKNADPYSAANDYGGQIVCTDGVNYRFASCTAAGVLNVSTAAGGTGVNSPPGSNTVIAPICTAAASPCTVTNVAQNILPTNANRVGCMLQATDVVDMLCKKNTVAGSAASTTNYDFILNAGAALRKGGGTYGCDTPGNVYRGPINCIASAADVNPNLAATESQ